MKLLVLGATGLVGARVLQRALADAGVARVIAPARVELPLNGKLVNPVGGRLEELVPAAFAEGPDAVVCALGTTIAKAGSKEAFRYVDYELPLTFAKAAHAAGVGTYAIVTAMGASADSRSFYLRTKGEVERDLRAVGLRSLTICRPSLIGGERNETRAGESVALTLFRVLGPILPKKLRINPADSIAASLLAAVTAAKSGCNFISSQEMT
jgi:uncharacterized protein YbjT (DUF2867 family)